MAQPFVSASLSDGSPPVAVESARFMEAEYEHERAVIVLNANDPTSKRFASDTPVVVDWGFRPSPSRFFVGYVSHTEPMHSPSKERNGERNIKVVCVAPSWALKAQGFETYRNVTPTAVVKAQGEALRFGVGNVLPSSLVEAALHQGGRSHWEFMIDCAKRAGFTLFARGLQLYCLDRREMVRRGSSTAPWLASSSMAGGTVTEMTPSFGAGSPKAQASPREAYAVNPRTGALIGLANRAGDKPVFAARSAPPLGFTKARTGLAVNNVGEAMERLAAEERLDRMSVTARLKASSNPQVRVGGVVVVLGYGADADGYWYVTDVTHEYTGPSRQTMDVGLARDTATAAQAPATPPVSSVSAKRGARLLGGRWVLA